MIGYGFLSTEHERKRSQKGFSKIANIETKIISSEKNILDGEMSLGSADPNLFIPGMCYQIKRMFNKYIRK